ncbi:hypothetical protein KUD97_14020 [Desulfovibrio desulfuricans]|uniref:glycosyltransferase family 10 domain-containing protein n=1 Tax=Desulfovibrio desulfuricans TaxID=876 RepID=UPI001F22A6A9|nr:glycosyltransferase family 10 [Desulfovibrio desulfuricans]UIB00009.1 hypothetical protein KUD97_14020 [Desulfovibrio desulfuricans]
MPAAQQPSCAFYTMHALWPWMRQTEDGRGGMPGCRFLLNREAADTQWLAVFDEPPAQSTTQVPKERRVLFITEPPEVKPYPASYLRQFGTVISPFFIRNAPRGTVFLENPCLNWHYGVDVDSCSSDLSNLDAFRSMPIPAKDKMLSVICSTKTFTAAQHKRIAFVEKLQKRFGNRVDLYGRGRNTISDKRIAIAPYKYHLVLENNYIDNFWTEKFSDTLLGYTYPIYLGAPNIAAKCPPGAMLILRPDNDEANLDAIERLLQEDPWEQSLPALRMSRQWVLDTTNVFSRMQRLIGESGSHMFAAPSLNSPVALKQSSRWQRALLTRLRRWGLYDPYCC